MTRVPDPPPPSPSSRAVWWLLDAPPAAILLVWAGAYVAAFALALPLAMLGYDLAAITAFITAISAVAVTSTIRLTGTVFGRRVP